MSNIPQRFSRLFLALFFGALAAGRCSAAALQFASPFVDHMVLQRGKPIEIWGVAPPATPVTVHLADQQADANSDADGNWHLALKALPAGGPFELTATAGAQSVKVTDLLIGDVWLCSGQSNMQMSLGECGDFEAVSAVPLPKVRLGMVGQAWTKTPQSTAKINWSAADAKTAKKFSAVAYYLAYELKKDPALKDVPIGILEDCLGGTVIESWIPQAGLAEFEPRQLQSSMFGIGPTLLFNAMIAPLGRTAFSGVVWYQGEGNAGQPEQYQKLLPILFRTWREQFNDPNLPIIVVQLPDYATDWGGYYWQWIREAEANAVAATPGTSLAISINTNDGWNLHPQGKHEIGRRLAMVARQDVYKEKIAGKGPAFKSARADGAKLIVTFETEAGPLSSGTGSIEGFTIAGKDGVYQSADAVIDGNTVILTAGDIPEPVTVRYAWAGVPLSTLTDESDIPAAPFRTDTLPPSKGHGELQRQPSGFNFKGSDYRLAVSGEGSVTSLIVHNQQLISNAPDSWGGTSFGNRNLGKMKLIGPQTLLCSDNETSFKIELNDKSLRWTLTNNHPADSIKFHIALSPAVSVTAESPNHVILKRKGAAVQVTGTQVITGYHDVAAEDGKVLEVDVPHGSSKVIEWSIQ